MHVADGIPSAAVIACFCRVRGFVIFCDGMRVESCEYSCCYSEYCRYSEYRCHSEYRRHSRGPRHSRESGNPAPPPLVPPRGREIRKREGEWRRGRGSREEKERAEMCKRGESGAGRHPHPPFVIPAKAGIHPHMARRVSGTQTNRRMDSRLHGNDGKRPPTWYRKLPAFLLAFPHPLSFPHPFCHSRTPSVIPAKAGIHPHMQKGRLAHKPTDGWIPVCTGMTERDPQHGTESCLHSFWHSRPPRHSRESGNLSSHGKKGAWLTNRRMDSRLHGNDGKRPPTWHRKLPAPFCHSRPPRHSRESGNLSSHGKKGAWLTNRRMDSRLHGNDGKRPPTWHRKLPAPFCHSRPPFVIPAKAGIQ